MESITCPNCGKQTNEIAIFCPNCSFKLPKKSNFHDSFDEEKSFHDSFKNFNARGSVGKKDDQKKNTRIAVSVIVAIILLIYLFSSNNSTDDLISPMKPVDNKEQTHVVYEESSQKQPEEPLKNQLKDQLKREIASFEKPFNSSNYRGTVEAMQIEIALFSVWAKIIEDGEYSLDEETNKLASNLKGKASALQVKEFPKLRQSYCGLVAEKLWEDNIYASTGGATHGILNLTGGLFADNKNIKKIQEILSEVLTQFRFKEVRYRWYKGASEYTYYKISSPKDSDVKQ